MTQPGQVVLWPYDLLHLEISYVFLEASNPTELLRKRWQVLRTQAPWIERIEIMAEQRHRFVPDAQRSCNLFLYLSGDLLPGGRQ